MCRLIWPPTILTKIPACPAFVFSAVSYNDNLVGENASFAGCELGVPLLPWYLETLPELRGGSWGDPWRLTRQGTCCSLAEQSRAKPGKPCPSQRPEENWSAEGEEKWRELLATPHSAQHPASSGQPTLLPTEPNQAIFVVDLSTTIFRIACMTSVGVVITRLRSLWVCPQHHSLQFSGSE